MDLLSKIEKRHQITLPPTYRVFFERGLITYPGNNYLRVHEAEWMPLSEIAEYEWPEYTKPKPGLVPFAFTGSGDLWCWYTKQISASGEPAIVHCPHDSFEGYWAAPSFIGWLYGVSLGYCASMWDDEEETKSNLRNWAALVGEFGEKKWHQDLLEILARSPKEYELGPHRIKNTGLLTDKEMNALLLDAFGQQYVDTPFIWDYDGEQKSG